jgi:hypothetical protein
MYDDDDPEKPCLLGFLRTVRPLTIDNTANDPEELENIWAVKTPDDEFFFSDGAMSANEADALAYAAELHDAREKRREQARSRARADDALPPTT